MSVIGTISTTIKQGSGDTATYETIVCAVYECKRTSITMPYKLISRLASDDGFVDSIAHTIISGDTLDLNHLMFADDSTHLDTDYLVAREREYPDLVRYDKQGRIHARTTTPAAFIRRFIVPAIEAYLDAAVITALGVNIDGMTAGHIQQLVKSIAHTEVSDKIRHHTDGTSTADKKAHTSRRARALAHK